MTPSLRVIAMTAALLSACTGTLSATDEAPPVAEDAAAPHEDAGPVTEERSDAGAPSADDAGPPPAIDAGSPLEPDAGAPSDPDAGALPSPDAGPPPVDAGPPDARPSSARHTPRPLGSTAAGQGYFEYLPPGYGDGEPRPLLLFLHGIGENGNGTTELEWVLRHGPPRVIDRDAWPNDRPFVVLSTQHRGSGCHTPAEIHAFLTYAIAEYEVDPDRVYLTGLSCGAIGAWSYVGQHLDEQIAALVPIAGNGWSAWNQRGCELGRLPIWAFHGDADEVVVPGGTTGPMGRLMECDPPPANARTTIYPGVRHDSWTATYDGSAGHDIYTWMLGFTRR